MACKADIVYNHILLNLLTYFMFQNVINLGECSYEFEEKKKKKAFCSSWLKNSVDSNYNQMIVLLNSDMSFLVFCIYYVQSLLIEEC